MPYLKQLITIVNQQLRATTLKEKRFDAGRYEVIAVDVTRKNADGVLETFPGVMNDSYEAEAVIVDDTYPIVIYHKILNKRYELNNIAGQRSEFGDRNKYVKETVTVKMVVYGKWSALKITKEELEAIISNGFPDNMDNQGNVLLKKLGLDNVTYNMQSSNFLSKQLWDEEYKGTEYRLAPEDIFFSTTYTIQSTWRKGCFQLCNCDYYLLTEGGDVIDTENKQGIKP